MHIFQPHRVRPRTGRIGGGYHKISSCVNKGGHHVVHPLMIGKRGGKNASGDPVLIQVQLLRPVQNVPDLVPVHQVLAVENRHTGEIGKRGKDKITVFPYPANGRIWVKTRQNRIKELLILLRKGGPVEKANAKGY